MPIPKTKKLKLQYKHKKATEWEDSVHSFEEYVQFEQKVNAFKKVVVRTRSKFPSLQFRIVEIETEIIETMEIIGLYT